LYKAHLIYNLLIPAIINMYIKKYELESVI
jgi:hypothetical protein